MSRVSLAFKSFFGLLFSGKLPDDVVMALNLTRRLVTPMAAKVPEPKGAAESAKPTDGAIQVLGLLQREARLVDFLYEDIASYTDDQVGAAVRDIHKQCRAVLDRHVRLAPVVDGVEGAVTRLAAHGLEGKDAGSVKLIGKVPPDGKAEAGILRHRGWKVERIDLPAGRTSILAPAEIEIE